MIFITKNKQSFSSDEVQPWDDPKSHCTSAAIVRERMDSKPSYYCSHEVTKCRFEHEIAHDSILPCSGAGIHIEGHFRLKDADQEKTMEHSY